MYSIHSISEKGESAGPEVVRLMAGLEKAGKGKRVWTDLQTQFRR